LVLLSIIFSAVIQVLLAWLTIPWVWAIRNDASHHIGRLAWWAFFALILIPALGGIVAGRLTDLFSGALGIPVPPLRDGKAWRNILLPKPVTKLFPPLPPSPWDRFFLERHADGQFVIITFDDGSAVAGSYYGRAFAATTPQVQGIFLAQEYAIQDGKIGAEIVTSSGVLVPVTTKIKHVKILAAESSAGGGANTQ
jgi:hypothetical protein